MWDTGRSGFDRDAHAADWASEKLAKPRTPTVRGAGPAPSGTAPHAAQSVTSAAAPMVRTKRGTTSSTLSRAHQSMSASKP